MYTLEVSDSSAPMQTDTDTVTITATTCQPDLSLLQGIVDGTVKTINFAPANFDPTVGDFPTEQQTRAGLLQLYEDGFRGILTYGVDGTLASIPRIAKEIGFQIVGVGIWDINDQSQIDTAVGLAEYTDFYIVGSEGIFSSRYTKQQLAERLEDVRRATCTPVTTSEPWDVLLANSDIFDMVDFVAVNIYGWWEGAHEAQDAVGVLTEHFDDVEGAAGGKIVIVRETGFPTGGHPDASVCRQQQYFLLLEQTGVPFVYLEAYDQFWKHEMHGGYDIGPHWGLYDRFGNRKECDEINNVPVADDHSLSTSFRTPVNITLAATDADGDDLTYTIELQPSNGTLSGTPPDVTYTPNAGFSGQDEFTFKANDGDLDSNLATVTITVEGSLTPTIEFTYVPPIGSFENLWGITYGVDYLVYSVVVYIKVDGAWWVKPYQNQPLTTIRYDGTWTCDITTGGHDQDATEIRAFVVSGDYDAGLHSLPEGGDYIAWANVLR
jgi:exo-beta-1,3-glucanase (GH17 family)